MGRRATTVAILLACVVCVAPPAASGPEEPEAPLYRSAQELPADPIQQGPGSVRFVLLDDATGAPVKSTFDLWRLDAPGNDHWTRGDQYQDHGDTEDEFNHLPLGRYRICVHAQRRSADDPPAFEVTAKETTHTFRVPMPRTSTVRLFLFDEQGAPVRAAQISRGRTMTADQPNVIPTWRQERKLRVGKRGYSTAGSMKFTLDARPTPRVDSGEGFLMGEVQEPSRVTRTIRHCRIHVKPGVEAEVRLAFEAPGVHTVQAVVLPEQRIHDAVRLPDGRRAIDAGANIHIVPRMRAAKPGAPADLEHLPSQVRAVTRSYQMETFDVFPGQPLAPITLRPVK